MTDEYLQLADWRRQVAAMFAAWRDDSERDAEAATLAFRKAKDRLFAEHAQSPLPVDHRASFGGLDYWPYDPTYRMTVTMEPDGRATGLHDAEPSSAQPLALPSSGPDAISFTRIGRIRLAGPLAGNSLSVFWIDAYGGGLFLPFRDSTSGKETYGAGRYALDTIKSADHGGDPAAGTLLIDFNMAFHPSCAYDPRWSCPLAPSENRLPIRVPVGERLRSGA